MIFEIIGITVVTGAVLYLVSGLIAVRYFYKGMNPKPEKKKKK